MAKKNYGLMEQLDNHLEQVRTQANMAAKGKAFEVSHGAVLVDGALRSAVHMGLKRSDVDAIVARVFANQPATPAQPAQPATTR